MVSWIDVVDVPTLNVCALPYLLFTLAPATIMVLCWHTTVVFVCGCVLALMLERGLFRNQALTDEKNFLTQLVHMQEEQYRTSKANVEMVNIKCHDMKHQISHITSTTDPDAIRELEQIISVYDSSLQTGNEILDVCLME